MKNILPRFAAASLIALYACSGGNSGTSSARAAQGKRAPDFTLPLSTGGSFSLMSLRGKPVYLNFFATWCPPCNEEAPGVNALQKKYASQGFSVVAVDELENAKQAESFRKKYSLVYPAVVDDGALQSQYAVNGLPLHVFIDRKGVIRSIAPGELSNAEIEKRIRAIL
ncbi:MAG: TlpA family protein disulfide reductase [Candidatus Eremiobacteraeota bacterium]|nr:TlpA family protein disulfide reductase [Candidatus Eremiobacteraeota bacterium]